MSIISHNICKGRYGYSSFCKLVKRYNPSIICLQEASPKLGEKIRDSIGDYMILQSPGRQGYCSNITLVNTRHIIKEIYSIDIQEVERDALATIVRIGNQELLVVNVHLKSGRGCPDIRKKQIDRILNNISHKRCLIVGDWNLSNNEIKWPIDGWKSQELKPTYRSNNRHVNSKSKFNHPFDRVLYKGMIVRDFHVINGDANSDHDILMFSIDNNFPIKERTLIDNLISNFKKII